MDKPGKTLTDYVTMALCPALIMAMVGSLAYFLLEISYAGIYGGVLRWTLFWFVLAMVLVSRIAIEQGMAYAVLYGVALAWVTMAMMMQKIGNVPAVWCLMGLIWWCTHKLTWDCTLIDEEADASGEGLLQTAGFEEAKSAPSPAEDKKLPGGRKGKQPAPRAKPHAPGLWVVYFSLLALPIFGIGQGFISLQNAAARGYAFVLVIVYVAAALGLLLATSVLGLRRYLRQRQLQMPATMAVAWMAWGAGLAVVVLLACLFLPRPDADWSMLALIDRLGSPPQKASNYAVLLGAPGEGKGRPLANPNSDVNEPAPGPPKGEKTVAVPGPTLTLPMQAAARLFTLLLQIAFILLILYWVIRHGRRLLAGLKQLFLDLLNLWRHLLGLRRPSRQPAAVAQQRRAAPRTLFAAFQNPFASGVPVNTEPAELVIYTFNALQAWAADRRFGRQPEQTPLEFARRLADKAPSLAVEAMQAAQLYTRVAYAAENRLPECQHLLAQLWQQMLREP